MNELIKWSIYEITTKETIIHWIMLRGRIRKFALENKINLLTDNVTDIENCVRFALIDGVEADKVSQFIKSIVADVNIENVANDQVNPVLSKMKVNKEDRYDITSK